jgi:hypothetical protein
MNSFPRITIIAAFLFFSLINIAIAQDQMILTNADELKVKVIEIGIEDISYKRADNLDGPVFKIPKKEVFLVVFGNGTTWKGEHQNKENQRTESEFSKQRSYNKSLHLIRDTTHHHLVIFHLGAPEINVETNLRLFLHGGLSYEWQLIGNFFGLRVMPYYSIAVASLKIVGKNYGKIGISLSPRFYVKNRRSTQFYLGLEGTYASYLVDDSDENELPWKAYIGGVNMLIGGHITQKSNFNLNVELGLGYKATVHTFDERVGWTNVYVSSTETIDQFVAFVRFGFGGRIRGKKK